jgi:hypothetical protein
MVDLRAALYASEESVRSQDPTLRDAAKKRRRQEARGTVVAGGPSNSGVASRSAADARADTEEEDRRADALRRKAIAYEQMSHGERLVGTDSLVDFESKARPPPKETGSCEVLTHQASSIEAARLAWERRARADIFEASNSGRARAQTHGAERLAEQQAAGAQTAASRCAAAEQKAKRQRALDERRERIHRKQQQRQAPTHSTAVGAAPSSHATSAMPAAVVPLSASDISSTSMAASRPPLWSVPPPPPSPPLPSGWHGAKDAEGRLYYYMGAHAQWERPVP